MFLWYEHQWVKLEHQPQTTSPNMVINAPKAEWNKKSQEPHSKI